MVKALYNFKTHFITTAITVVLLSACINNEIVGPDDTGDGIESLNVSQDFDFVTSAAVTSQIRMVNNEGNPLPEVVLSIYNDTPPSLYNDDPTVGGSLMARGITNAQGVFAPQINIPAHIDRVYIQTDYIGLPDVIEVEVVNGQINFDISKDLTSGKSTTGGKINTGARTNNTYTYIGTYNNQGVPDYLESERDNLDQSFLNDVNSSLPERAPVPTANPQYLANGNEIDVNVTADADVWVTFVHEGAGYRNALGFYTYPTDSAPSSIDDISALNIIFPNVSFRGSGGGLTSGDKVRIGRFSPGTSIGWFIVANGWNGTDVGNGNGIYFSNPSFNPENGDGNLKQHNVILNDRSRQLFILGFEDLRRDGASDDDFNDAIFYVSANPIEAIEVPESEEVTTTLEDSDEDGITDQFDDYPNDPDQAFDNYYPAENTFGTLAFEDLWPSKGDYDFNDLVVDYNFKTTTNGDNEVLNIEATFIVRAIGASFKNGFGFQTNLNPADVASVSGYSLTQDYVTLSANGTEAGQDNATIIVFDNAFDVLEHPGGGALFVNTVESEPSSTPDTIRVNIALTGPKTVAETGLAPFNPFIIINGERGKEVHLPGSAPTSLADASLFGTGIDNTDPAQNRFYKSTGNLPWGMNIPESFAYPIEKVEVLDAHLVFGEWVQSDGFNRQDWYQDKFGYRNNANIYNR